MHPMRSTRCAATLNERLDPLPGDHLVPDAVLCATHAICIEASPEHVWPWLAQMGAGRGGWYSHDWLAGRAARSADRLIPGVKDLSVGDVIPGTPDGTPGFVVSHVKPPHELVLLWPSHDFEAASASWAFVLRASPDGRRTRLLVRARPASQSWLYQPPRPAPICSSHGQTRSGGASMQIACVAQSTASGTR